MGLLDNRVAVVTGAGRGIGKAIALGLAQEGASLVINDLGVDPRGRHPDDTPALEVVRAIEEAGGAAVGNHDDVASWDGAASIIDSAVSNFGRIDILVNNAGFVRFRSFQHMTEEQWDSVIGVHLKGAFNCCRHAVRHMIEQGHGRIINITSGSVQGFKVQANYAAAKSGVIGLTMVLALELAEHGITANALAPSGLTRLAAVMLPWDEGEEPPEWSPSHNGPLVAWLASDKAAHVNGQVFGRGVGDYQLFQQPLTPVVSFYKPGAMTAAEFVERAPTAFDPYLQPVGNPAVTEEIVDEFVAKVDKDD